MASNITPWKDFAEAQLETFQARDDYPELFELSIIFWGGTSPSGIRFPYPGAIHRGRWMG
jgi:hypothetical protein